MYIILLLGLGLFDFPILSVQGTVTYGSPLNILVLEAVDFTCQRLSCRGSWEILGGLYDCKYMKLLSPLNILNSIPIAGIKKFAWVLEQKRSAIGRSNGNANQVKPRYPEALVTYGPPPSPHTQPAFQRATFYPNPQQKPYYPAQVRRYTPVQPRPHSVVPQRTFTQPQTRAYTYRQPRPVYTPVQQRSYPSTHPQPYAPVNPQAYSHPHQSYALPQTRTYTHPAAAYGQRPSTGYLMSARLPVLRPVVRQPMRAAVRQSINTGLRQPINTAVVQPMTATLRQPIRPGFAQQPVRNLQTPFTRALAPKPQTLYRPAVTPVAQFPQSLAARPVLPLGLGTYGRNHIPKTPGRNNIHGKPIPPGKNHPLPQYRNIKRNNIAVSNQNIPQTPKKTQTERNYINGISIPQNLAKGPIKPQVNPNPVPIQVPNHSPVAPTKPQTPPNPATGHKLSTFLRKVNNLQDTLKGTTMKQGLIYYDDDVSNKSHHRPTNFAPPTRKLGSMGSPGGSRVTFNEERAVRPAIIPETKVVNQAGSERVNIAQNNKNVANNDGTKKSNKNDPTRPSENDAGSLVKKTVVEEKPLPANAAGAKKSQTDNTAGSAKSSKFAAAQVDLGLLKEKVLHSNNSKFLKRVLHVLRKYTKLMKTSMEGKNNTKNVLNVSMTETKVQIPDPKEVKELNSKDASKTNKANSDSGVDISNALNSTKTAVKIFDMLNSASKENLNSSMVKELNNESSVKNSSLTPGSQRKPESESETVVSDLMSSNAKTETTVKDENASKKGIIATEKNVGKPVFSFDKLKNGLERGNTID